MERNRDNHVYYVEEIRLQEVVCRLFGKQRGYLRLFMELHAMNCLSDRVSFVVEKEGSTPLKPREIAGKELLGDVISLHCLLGARQRLNTLAADTLFPIINHSSAHRTAPREEELQDTMEDGEGQVEFRVESLVPGYAGGTYRPVVYVPACLGLVFSVDSAAKVVKFGDICKG